MQKEKKGFLRAECSLFSLLFLVDLFYQLSQALEVLTDAAAKVRPQMPLNKPEPLIPRDLIHPGV